jgi:adenylate kinase family enzyme
MKNICCLIGPPGSGKGTNSIFFLEKNAQIKALRVSIGEELRKSCAYKSAKLAPVQKIKKIIEKELGKDHNNFLFDGYPREKEQLELILNKDLNIIVLNIMVEDRNLLVDILSKRYSCHSCGRSNTMSKPCISCGEKMEQRDDDLDKNKVLERLDIYYTNLEEIKTYAKENNIPFIQIEGQKESTFNEINQVLFGFFYH